MELLGLSKNGVSVYFDPIHSHAATHFQDTPQLKELVREALMNTELAAEKEHFEYDFKRVVGTTDLFDTDDSDTIIYAKRVNRDNYTRFVLDKEPPSSSVVTLVLYKNEDIYTLYSAWVGILVPSFPTAPTATPDSIPFWKVHALAWGSQPIQPGTELKEWPWPSS